MMLEKCNTNDFHDIYEIINDAAAAYKGVIPADRWHEPYMSEMSWKLKLIRALNFGATRKTKEFSASWVLRTKETLL